MRPSPGETYPKFTNWNQVGGDNEPIIRYLPQAGSGTLSFFETRILGLTEAQQGVLDGSAWQRAATAVEENHGNQVSLRRPRQRRSCRTRSRSGRRRRTASSRTTAPVPTLG